MANINRNPSGALELLNLNLQGEFPRPLQGTVGLGLDLERYYLDGIGIRVAQTNGNILVAGTGITIGVPDGELWAIRGVSLYSINLDAATVIGTCIRFVMPGTTGWATVNNFNANHVTNQGHDVGQLFQDPVLLPSDGNITGLMTMFSGVPVAGVNLVLNVLYYPLTLR